MKKQTPLWLTLLIAALGFVGMLAVGKTHVNIGYQKGLAEADRYLDTEYQIGMDSGMRLRSIECHESFDELQTRGILVDDPKSGWKRNWDYIETLVCDGPGAGEAP